MANFGLIKTASAISMLCVIYIVPPGALELWVHLSLLGASMLPYVACVLEEHRLGKEHDRKMKERFE